MATSYRRYPLDDELRDEALERARGLPVFEGSHREQDASIVGCIGEVVFERFLKRNEVSFVDDRRQTTHDYIINGRVILDVKTKDRTVAPRRHYDNSVPLYNHGHQRPDYYYFISLKRDRHVATSSPRAFQDAFILGGISLSKLEELGVTWRKGDIDPSNGTKFWTDCINVKMGNLLSNEEMLEVFRGGPWADPKVLGSKSLYRLTRLLGKLDARGHLDRWRR